MLNKDQVILFLNSLPDEKTRIYEVKLTEFAVNNNHEIMRNNLIEIMEEVFSDKVCYNAFYCLNIMYRRTKDYPKLNSLIEGNANRFKKHITYQHLYTLYCIESDSIYDYGEILRSTYNDSKVFKDNAGFVHLFADVFATIFEKGGICDVNKFISDWYEEALHAVNKAIEMDPLYAKYYCTKARILCTNKEFDQAEYYINYAIGYEDSQRSDYILRIQSYQYYKIMIKMQNLTDRFDKRLNSIETNTNTEIEGCRKNDFIKDELKPYIGNEPFIFVSYSHNDSEEVYRLLKLLQDRGLRIWFDKGGIPASVDFTEFIAQKIIDCEQVLFMVSPSSVNAEYVRMEIRSALENRKIPICVFLESTVMSPGMRMQIGGYQHIYKYEMNDNEFINSLMPIFPKDVLRFS